MRKLTGKGLILIFIFLKGSACSFSQNTDVDLLNKINSPETRPSDTYWKITSASDAPVSLATPVTLFTVGLINKDETLKKNGILSGITFLTTTGLTMGLKYSIKRERPFNAYPGIIVNKVDAGTWSFPSGHTSTAFATATSLTLTFPKWYVAVPAYLWAGTVAYSRMHLGVHYPSDLLGGIVIGVGSGFLVWGVDRWLNK
ncbi:MAG: phosphatase PAP2 family protein [Bacteroidota bacterium]